MILAAPLTPGKLPRLQLRHFLSVRTVFFLTFFYLSEGSTGWRSAGPPSRLSAVSSERMCFLLGRTAVMRPLTRERSEWVRTRLFHARLRALQGTGRLAEDGRRVPAEALEGQRRPMRLRPTTAARTDGETAPPRPSLVTAIPQPACRGRSAIHLFSK